jgi:hypothetical protein
MKPGETTPEMKPEIDEEPGPLGLSLGLYVYPAPETKPEEPEALTEPEMEEPVELVEPPVVMMMLVLLEMMVAPPEMQLMSLLSSSRLSLSSSS